MPTCPASKADTAVRPRRARALALTCLSLAALLPTAVAWHLFKGWPLALAAALSDPAHGAAAIAAIAAAPTWRLALVAALALLPVSLIAWALCQAWRCLAIGASGAPLSAAAVSALRAFARGVFAAAVAGIVVPPLAAWVLSAGLVAQPSIAFAVHSHQVLLMLFAAITWQIAALLAQAVAIAEENAQFV